MRPVYNILLILTATLLPPWTTSGQIAVPGTLPNIAAGANSPAAAVTTPPRNPSSAKQIGVEATPSPADRAFRSSVPAALQPPRAEQAPKPLALQPRPKFKVAQIIDLNATVTVQEVQNLQLRERGQIEFTDEQFLNKAGEITIVREIISAEWESTQPTGIEPVIYRIAQPGQRFQIAWTDEGVQVTDIASGERVWDQRILTAMGSAISPDLWPAEPLTPGLSWTLTGSDLARRIHLLPVEGGKLELSVEKLATNSSLTGPVASISGKLETLLPLSPVSALFSSDVRLELPLQWKVPLRLTVSGTLAAKSTITDQMGDPVNVSLSGRATVDQICELLTPPQQTSAALTDGLITTATMGEPANQPTAIATTP